ncbi:zinc finger protein [Penicillium samsonianum]|uniref:zinc finger protein n=1 Tax=Penicillium samsonianum TaxID=1882272 RepID=UPI002546BC6F|nr:zinc finger protein [Penicillium samsonianum]KAJ6149729.1 zinc finger protein [Penicillium samsonianum]
MYECGTCDFKFRYQGECDSHMDYYDHWVECETYPPEVDSFALSGAERGLPLIRHPSSVCRC